MRPNITWKPVRNFTKGRTFRGVTYPILGIVDHIMQGTMAGTRSWFNNRASQASAHFGVGRDGSIQQWVDVADRAWHAGLVRNPRTVIPYPGVSPSWWTIGIEYEGKSGEPLTPEQYAAGLELHKWLLSVVVRPDLPLRQRVIGHFQLNSIDRPNCPGSAFPWEQLYVDLAEFESSKVRDPRLLVEGHQLPILVQDGRSYAPVRALLEALGYTVIWEEETQSVVARR